MEEYDYDRAISLRKSDEDVADTGSRAHWAKRLTNITGSFERQISVLDVGCGTGRFLYCLKNVEHLLGVDVSKDMLEQARNPLRADQVDIKHIDLMCADIFNANLPNQSFDLIYSIGVLGECAPFNEQLCKKLLALLKPNGKMFITIADTHSRYDMQNIKNKTFLTSILRKVFPYLPAMVKYYINKSQSSFYMTHGEIEACFKSSGVTMYENTKYDHPIGTGWQGSHYDCIIIKGQSS